MKTREERLRKMVNCPKCGSNNIRFTVDLMISAPTEFISRISKQAIKRSDVHLQSANWQKIRFYCIDCLYAWPEFEMDERGLKCGICGCGMSVKSKEHYCWNCGKKTPY